MKNFLQKFRLIRFLYWRILSIPKYLMAAFILLRNYILASIRMLSNASFHLFRLVSNIATYQSNFILNFFKRVLRWLYWRSVFARNLYRAQWRFIKNNIVAFFRFFHNYIRWFLMFVFHSLRGPTRPTRIYRQKLNSLDTLNTYTETPGLFKNTSTSNHYNPILSIPAFIEFFKHRFSRGANVKDIDIENSWIEISQSDDRFEYIDHIMLLDANLILHIHYLDIAVEMISCLIKRNLRFRQVIVTTTIEDSVPFLLKAVQGLTTTSPNVILVKNSFRDARPFLIAIKELNNSFPVLKLHTKKSPHLLGREGEVWRRDLVMGLVPSAITAQRFTQWLEGESKPAVLCPSDWLSNKKEWGRNDLYVYMLCDELGIKLKRKAPFPKGTMFWINNEMVKIFSRLAIPASQHHSERNWVDSTWAHGLERLIGQVVVDGGRGYKIRTQSVEKT